MTEASLIKFMCRYTLTSLNIIRIIRLLQLFYILLQLTDRTKKFPTRMENTYYEYKYEFIFGTHDPKPIRVSPIVTCTNLRLYLQYRVLYSLHQCCVLFR